MRLIDADVLYDFLAEQKGKETGAYSKGRNHGFDVARSALHNEEITPTIDAVPVVRCRECRHYEPCEGGKDFCCLHRIGVVKDDFCSYGERKEGEE